MLMDLIRAIAERDEQAFRWVEAHPGLARMAVDIVASRGNSSDTYFESIGHYVYGGDTALHVAAAAHDPAMTLLLLAKGASVHLTNRRGARPLHYAVDAVPGRSAWNPVAQTSVVHELIDAGADLNALDKSGVGALHRAVRTRSAGAVRALLSSGADVRLRNANGSTPLHLAVHRAGQTSPSRRHAPLSQSTQTARAT